MKRILLIGFNYFNYTSEIVTELRAQGSEVTFYDIQPGRVDLKLLRKFAPTFYPRRLNQYHRSILKAERGRVFDLVLFIQVHQMTLCTLSQFRDTFKTAEFVLYNWDAVTNHDYRPYLRQFHRVYTFDPVDARTLGVRYLPLFCIPAFQGLRQRPRDSMTVYFVGNLVNPRRYEAVAAFKRYCRREGIQFRYYLSSSTHAYAQLLRSGTVPWDVSLRSIQLRKFVELVESSIAVFDFANHRQAGYTMRTIENLCAGKKIITNNSLIRAEAFFSDDRIHVFRELDFTGVKEFLARPLSAPQKKFSEFHLSSFVRRLSSDTSGL